MVFFHKMKVYRCAGYRWAARRGMLALAVVLCACPGVNADDKVAELLDARLQLSAERQQLQEAADRDVNAKQQQLGRLTDDLHDVDIANAAQSTLLQELAEKVAKNAERQQAQAAQLAAWQTAAGAVCAKLEARVAGGIPFQREARLERLQTIHQQLAATDAAVAGKGIAQLLAFLGEELALSRESSLAAEAVAFDSRRLPAYRLRTGLASEGFVSEDGRQVGIAAGDGKWRLDLNDTERDSLRQAVAVMRHLRSPAIQPLPVMPAREGK